MSREHGVLGQLQVLGVLFVQVQILGVLIFVDSQVEVERLGQRLSDYVCQHEYFQVLVSLHWRNTLGVTK